MSSDYSPAVIAAPGVTASSGSGEGTWTPRNIMAFSILLMFAFYLGAPYFLSIPEKGQSATLILTSGKVLETVLMLVLAFYFGTTVGSAKKDDTIRQQALAAPPPQLALPPPDPTQTLVTPSSTSEVTIKETVHEPVPDAGGRTDAAAVAPAPSGFQPGDGGPPE